jgi:enoyl-CoA hydratase/carnithine racemase
MLSTDIRAAAPEARGLTEVKWSIYPFAGSTIKLIQQIDYVHAMDLLLRARLIDAGEAARLGLVNRLVPISRIARSRLPVVVSGSLRSGAHRARPGQICRPQPAQPISVRASVDLYCVIINTSDLYRGRNLIL